MTNILTTPVLVPYPKRAQHSLKRVFIFCSRWIQNISVSCRGTIACTRAVGIPRNLHTEKRKKVGMKINSEILPCFHMFSFIFLQSDGPLSVATYFHALSAVRCKGNSKYHKTIRRSYLAEERYRPVTKRDTKSIVTSLEICQISLRLSSTREFLSPKIKLRTE